MSRARRDDVEVIEIVAADPTVFGGTPVAVTDDASPREPRATRRPAPTWLPGLAVVLLVAVAGGVAWKLAPWHRDERLVVRSMLVPPTLTDRLVIGEDAGTPVRSWPGLDTTATATPTPTPSIIAGAVFSDPSTSAAAVPASALFWVTPSDVTDTGTSSGDQVRIQGRDGTILRGDGEFLLHWPSPTGRGLNLRTAGITESAALRLAEQLASTNGVVTVRQRSTLGRLRPVGTVHDLQMIGVAFDNANFLSSTAAPSGYIPATPAIAYPDATLSVGPSTGPELTSLLIAYLPLGTFTHATVHGHDALVVVTGDDGTVASSAAPADGRTIVVWQEGGRTIAVRADSTARARALAGAVRPATSAEWQAVQAVSQPTGGTTAG